MQTLHSLFGTVCHTAAFLIAATAALAHSDAQQPRLFLATEAAPILAGSDASSSDPMPSDPTAANPRFDLGAAAFRSSQPPPRRYGRPNYSAKTSNSDGSAKYEFLAGVGAGLPLGNTHAYETPNWGFQTGGGRNFNRNFGVILQFDYDHFGLQAATINNETGIYNTLLGCTPAESAAGSCVAGLDGNNHVWSFTLNPTFTLAAPGLWNAYAVLGGGFYHKVTNFTQPTTQEECSIYGCGYFSVTSTVGRYTSNAAGVNGGFGVTRKLYTLSNLRVYLEARYVLIFNQQRNGITAANVSTAPASANFYPANSNRTTYLPIKLGVRF
jgi:hypothetical protein